MARVAHVERTSPSRRLACIWHPAPRGEHWVGVFSTARVVVGAPAYQWSDGEIVVA